MQYLHTQGGAGPERIDVVSLARVLRRNAIRLLVAALGVGVAVIAGLSFVTPRYTSEAQILIGGQGLNDRLRDPQVGSATLESVSAKVDKEAVASQVIALRSRDLATRLMLDLDLASKPEFSVAPSDAKGAFRRLIDLAMGLILGARETPADRALTTYYRGLNVYQGKDSRVITIQYSSTDSALAARVANRLAELYQDWLRSQGVSQTADASDWLKPQIEKLSREVSEAEAEVERFRSEANLFRAGSQNSGLNEQQLADLGSEVTRARAARTDVEARAAKARELLQLGQLDVIPDVQRAPVIQALLAERARAEREKAEGEATLLPRHPRMRQLDATLADLRRQIAREAAIIVEGVEKEASAARLREDLAGRRLAEMKALVGDKAADMARLTALEGVAKAKRREIDTLQASFEAARSRGDAKAIPLEAQIISRAQPGSVPSFPKRLQLSALAAAATLLLGMVAAITRELVRSARLPTDPDAGNQADHRAPIPAMPGHETREYPVMVASLGVAARHLRTKVHVDRGHRTLVVGMAAAADAREHGVELARLLAGPGARTVVIDWNADGRSIAETLGAHRHPGIAELLQGTASLHQAIQLLPGSTGVRFISPGGGLPNTAMHADQANLIFDTIDDAYDHIVFVGEYDALDALFTVVKGRFDTVVEISAPAHVQAARSAPGILFGFPVSGIEVLRLGVDARPQRRPATLARHSAEALS
jgi:succinoglycan biosynthesis transport protein ExoP